MPYARCAHSSQAPPMPKAAAARPAHPCALCTGPGYSRQKTQNHGGPTKLQPPSIPGRQLPPCSPCCAAPVIPHPRATERPRAILRHSTHHQSLRKGLAIENRRARHDTRRIKSKTKRQRLARHDDGPTRLARWCTSLPRCDEEPCAVSGAATLASGEAAPDVAAAADSASKSGAGFTCTQKSDVCVCVCVRQDETSGAEGIRRMRARARKGYSGTFYLPRFSDLPSASEHTTPLCCRQGALPCRA